MPIVPIRGVGELGVITDLNSQDLPFNAWQSAKNLRFSRGVASRYSVFKHFDTAYSYSKRPIGILEGGGLAGEGYLVTVFNDGSMEQRHSGTTTNVTPTGTLSTDDSQITTSFLGGLTYVNRPSDVPVYRKNPADGAFAPITGWDPLDRCKSLRSFKDFLIAINVTKGSTEFPAMLKWSDAAQAGVPPDDWDTADASSLAGENIINDCRDRLVDGHKLGDMFILYGASQAFRVHYIGQPFIFRTENLFSDAGVIGVNCVQDVDGAHYVFGQDDIYIHDGFSKRSLVDDRVRKEIFRELDYDARAKFYTYHDRINGEIGFCYVSVSDTNEWKADEVDGCNKAAVFNYKSDTWTFVDMPSVIGGTATSDNAAISWADLNDWDDLSTSWSVFKGSRPSSLVLCSSGNSGATVDGRAYYLDDLEDGLRTNQVATEVLWTAHGEWVLKDLDELQVELYGTKLIKSIIPQFYTQNPDAIVEITFGHSDNLNADIQWQAAHHFRAYDHEKYDTRRTGRYISIRIVYPSGVAASFGGFDLDIMQIARR